MRQFRPFRLVPCLLALCVAVPWVGASGFAVEHWEVEAGTTAILVEDHRAPLVELQVEFPAGLWSPWLRRTHAGDAFEIQLYDERGTLRARVDRLAVDLSLVVERRSSVLVASFLSEDLDAVIALVRDVLRETRFDTHELSRWRSGAKIDWKSAQKQPFFRAGQEVARLFFELDDPRRMEWEKPPPVLTKVARLAAARDTLIRLPGRVVAFAGDVTREQVDRLARGLLPPALDAPPPDLAPTFLPIRDSSSRPTEHAVDHTGLTQVYFGFARDSLTYEDPDYPRLLLADHVLGGHFYSRLYVALRHDSGETYAVWTAGKGTDVREAYSVATFTRADNAAAAEAKLRDAVRRFREAGITEDERVAAIGFLRGRKTFRHQTPEQSLERFLYERRLGLPPGHLDAMVERASRLDLEKINAFVREFYDPARFSLVRLEPR